MFDPSTSEDVGRSIPRAGGNREPVAATMAWPDDISIQGGPGGVVFVREPAESQAAFYRTAFVEAFPGGTFTRGEGATVAEAERACWDRYQRWLHCPGPTGEHSWKPGCTAGSGKWIAYRNGAGFCEYCNAFGSGRFTAEQLGQFCSVCATPTLGTCQTDADGTVTFLCREHDLLTLQVCLPAELAAALAGPDPIAVMVGKFLSDSRSSVPDILDETGWMDPSGAPADAVPDVRGDEVTIAVSLRACDVWTLRFDAEWRNASEEDAVAAIVKAAIRPRPR